MTVQFTNGMMVEVAGGEWLIHKKLLHVYNAQHELEIEAPISSVMLVTRADLQSAKDAREEDIKKLEAVNAFNQMILGAPDDSKGTVADVQG